MSAQSTKHRAAVVGGGLAGCEAANMIAAHGHGVDLFEMKPQHFSPAHHLESLAELVCSNSLGSLEEFSAPGLLKFEMNQLGSRVLEAASASSVPAGRALSVDREKFSKQITEAILSNPLIRVIREECSSVPDYEVVIIATGPLTSDSLAADLESRLSEGSLYFYDSISPIVTADSIDYSHAFFGSRYMPESDDYLNCPLDRELYETFVREVVLSEKVPVKSFEAMHCFEACLPIEVMAERGLETLRFGPMKPVGLLDPKTGRRPYGVIQLRRENTPTTLYNLVGFQTRMKWGEQTRIFRMVPALRSAEFARMGSMHRNTFINSPLLLDSHLRLISDPRILFAGQLTGVEGYVESAAMGQWAGLVAACRLSDRRDPPLPPRETAFGSLLYAITTEPTHGKFAPMNINFGLLPPLPRKEKNKMEQRRQMVFRARASFMAWRESVNVPRLIPDGSENRAPSENQGADVRI